MDMVNLKKIDDLPDQPDGVVRWRVKFTWSKPSDPPGTKRRCFYRHFTGTLARARLFRDHHKFHLKAGRNSDDYPLPWEDGESRPHTRIKSGEHTYRELWEEYERWRQGRIDAGRAEIELASWAEQKQVMNGTVIPAIGDMIIERTDARDLEEVINQWGRKHLRRPGEKKTKEHRRAGTLDKWLRYLRLFLGWVSDELQVYDPSGRLGGFQDLVHDEDLAKPTLRVDQVRKLLETIREGWPQIYGISWVSFYGGGLRWKIPSALKWADVDEDAKVIRIVRQQVKGSIRPVTQSDRKGSPAGLPLAPFAQVLAEHRQWMVEAKHPGRQAEFIFPCWSKPSSSKYDGMWAHNKSYNDWLGQACEAAKVPVITHHGWRRAFNSIALEHSGEPETVIRRMTGHVTQEMTDYYYDQSAAQAERLICSVQDAVRAEDKTEEDASEAA